MRMRMHVPMVMVMIVIVYNMSVVVLMTMAFMTGTAEESARLVRGEVGDNIAALLKAESNAGYMMSLKHTHHHLLIDREWHIHLCALHHSGPMLIADGMTKFQGDSDYGVMILICDSGEVDHQHRIEFESQHHGPAALRIKVDHITVGNLSVSCQSHRILRAAQTLPEETRFLGSPLIKIYLINLSIDKASLPFIRLADIAEHFSIDFHSSNLMIR